MSDEEDSLAARVAVVLVNYRYSKHVIDYIQGNDWSSSLKIVVVDNSEDAEEELALRAAAQDHESFAVLVPPKNVGFGEAVNRGIAHLSESEIDSVIVLNPDCRLTQADLDLLARAIGETPDLLVAPTIWDGSGEVWFGGSKLRKVLGFGGQSRQLGRSAPDWISGACFAVSLSSWRRMPNFLSEYFLYWEDVDLGVRWRQAGGTLAVETRAKAIHDVGATHSHTAHKSDLYIYFNIRNRLVFARRNLSRTRAAAWTILSLPYCWKMLRLSGIRDLRRMPHFVNLVVRATADGLSGRLNPPG